MHYRPPEDISYTDLVVRRRPARCRCGTTLSYRDSVILHDTPSYAEVRHRWRCPSPRHPGHEVELVEFIDRDWRKPWVAFWERRGAAIG